MTNNIPPLVQMSFKQWRDQNKNDFDVREKAEINEYHPDLCYEYTQRVKRNTKLWYELWQRKNAEKTI